MQQNPNALHMFFGIATLLWLGHAWDTYMQMNLYGSLSALFAGVTFLFFAHELAPSKEASWLFGWNDDPITHALMRMWVYASLFVGPITRHASQAIAPDLFENRKSYIVIIIASTIIGIGMSIYIRTRNGEGNSP